MAMITTMKKLKSGYINGTRVTLGNLGDFLNTSAITNLSFLGSQEDGYPDSEFLFRIFIKFISFNLFQIFIHFILGLNPQVQQYLEEHLMKSFSHKSSLLTQTRGNRHNRMMRRRMSCKGAIKKTRSINVDC